MRCVPFKGACKSPFCGDCATYTTKSEFDANSAGGGGGGNEVCGVGFEGGEAGRERTAIGTHYSCAGVGGGFGVIVIVDGGGEIVAGILGTVTGENFAHAEGGGEINEGDAVAGFEGLKNSG